MMPKVKEAAMQLKEFNIDRIANGRFPFVCSFVHFFGFIGTLYPI
jgi:hypothetical protein